MPLKTKGCPTAKTAELLSDPWTMLITRDLLRGEKHFCDLERSLEGISTRTLTAKLKILEEKDIVRKNMEGVYLLTSRGKALGPIQKAMDVYGKKYL